eukprot:TRINITY_DN5763_c0_g1_i1.p1 TRINITY_DN5763_c0_g1~~TRINITY_DN5763_c0_g1_i1.p1  ORF type:complete len:140 (+),score=29.26 TRINITY_DN5763_c0_g1_i1:165-584(+)
MASGAGLSDDIVQSFNDFKIRHDSRYITFKMSADNTQVVIEKKAAPTASYGDFVADLPKNECRFAVYDLHFTLEDGERSKILFVMWAPDTAPVRNKMLYTATKAALRRALVGIAVEIQATDASEIDEEAVLDKAKKSGK